MLFCIFYWIYFYLSIIIYLHTVVWFQVFLSNTNDLLTVVWFQVFLKNTNNLHLVIWFGLMSWEFGNGPGDLVSIPGRVIPKTLKMVLDATLLNTQHYKVWIKGKMELILIVIGTVIRGLVLGLEDVKIRERVETILMTALIRFSRILRKVRETWGDLLSLRIQWKNIS